MTNKRYWYDFEDPNGHKIIDTVIGKEYSLETVGDFDVVTDLLNKQHEENKQLKSENQGIQDKVWRLLELLGEENGIDKKKIIDWWNGGVWMSEKKRFDLVDTNLIGNESRGITDFDENKHYNMIHDDYKIRDLLNALHEENEQLKKEVEMLRNGLKAYDEILPLYLDCEDIMHFNNELYEFEMERMDFYKKYPNRIHYKGGDVE